MMHKYLFLLFALFFTSCSDNESNLAEKEFIDQKYSLAEYKIDGRITSVYDESFDREIAEINGFLQKRMERFNLEGGVFWKEKEQLFKVYFNSNNEFEGIELAKELIKTADLKFYHTFNNTAIGNEVFEDINNKLSRILYPGAKDSILDLQEKRPNSKIIEGIVTPEGYQKVYPLSKCLDLNVNKTNHWIEGPVLGYVKESDTAKVMEYLTMGEIKAVLRKDLRFAWSLVALKDPYGESYIKDNEELFSLFLLKTKSNGKPQMDGTTVAEASADFIRNTTNSKVILNFNSIGSSLWRSMTEYSAVNNTSIAICIDNKVFSAPVAGSKIEGGSTEITGGSFNGTNGINVARDVASLLNDLEYMSNKLKLHKYQE